MQPLLWKWEDKVPAALCSPCADLTVLVADCVYPFSDSDGLLDALTALFAQHRTCRAYIGLAARAPQVTRRFVEALGARLSAGGAVRVVHGGRYPEGGDGEGDVAVQLYSVARG